MSFKPTDIKSDEISSSDFSDLKEISPGCYFYKQSNNINFINENIISKLIAMLSKQNLYLGRICLHSSYNDLIQTMIIALHENYKVASHFHNGPELLKIISGELIITENRADGSSKDYHLSKDQLFLIRLSKGVVHSVQSKSKWAIFLEVGNGPFDENKTNYI